MPDEELDQEAALAMLNRILETELAGVVRYTHYSFMVFGYNRLPIVAWLRGQASESLTHAQEAGELITQLGGHPSLGIGALLETHKHDIGDILRESLEHESEGLVAYRRLLDIAEGHRGAGSPNEGVEYSTTSGTINYRSARPGVVLN